MRGFLNITHKNPDGSIVRELKPNDLFTVNARRWFTALVEGFTPLQTELGGSPFFKGGHTYDLADYPHARIDSHNNEIAAGVFMSTSGEVMRHRARATKSSTAPVFPSQIAYALGAAYTFTDAGSLAPTASWSGADFGIGQIGNVFGHPAGRRAYFTEPAITPNGNGAVNPNTGATPVFGPFEQWHFINDIRIVKDGTETSAEYVWQRRPYFMGSYEVGANLADFTGTHGLSARFPSATVANPVNARNSAPFQQTPTPFPPQVDYNLDFPTASADTNSICTGMVSDEQDPEKIWFVVSEISNSNQVDNSRSLWAYKWPTTEPPQRMDAPDGFADNSLSGWPSLDPNSKIRDLKMTRGGVMFAAVDSDDDDGNGANQGALLVIDVRRGSEAVTDVYGEAAGTPAWGTVYTAGGLQQYNVLAIAVDRSDSYAPGSDRVWLLHRNGLTRFDINNTTRIISGITTYDGTGVVDSGSVRGLGGALPPGSGGFRGSQSTMIDVDSAGEVYWVTTALGGTFDTVGPQRLNKLTGDGATHTYYSINSSAEGGALGFINMGIQLGGVTMTVTSMRIFRKEAGDPDDDVIWLATGNGGSAAGQRLIQAIPVSEFTAQNNPGAGYFHEDLTNQANPVPWFLTVDRANNVIAMNTWSNDGGILESFGRADFISGTIDQFGAPAGSLQTITKLGGTAWHSRLVGKRIRINGGTNSANRGSFIIDSVGGANSLTIRNSGGAATAAGEAAPFDHKGTEFDTSGTVDSAIGTASLSTMDTMMYYNPWVNDTGISAWHYPFNGAAFGYFNFYTFLASMHLWDSVGSQWYRRRIEHQEAATARGLLDGSVVNEARTCHNTEEDLKAGNKVAFANQNNGNNEFFAGEYYTWGTSPGVFKDATQEITYGWDLYSQRALLQDDRLSPKTAAHPTAVGGRVNTGSLASVTTSNPFTLTTEQGRQLVHWQRRLELNGAANTNTQNLRFTNGTWSNTNGIQLGIDVGSNLVCEQLRFILGVEASGANFWEFAELELYSSDATDGSSLWTLRASYRSDQDHPEWLIATNAFNDAINEAAETFVSGPVMIMIDIAALDDNGVLTSYDGGGASSAGSPGAGDNIAMRYWKLVFRLQSPETNGSMDPAPGAIVAYGTGPTPAPLGVSSALYIDSALDSNYMANYIIRATWLIDDDATAGGTGVSSSGVTVTLGGGGTFSTDIGGGDFLRILDGGQNIVSEHLIDTRDSGIQLTLDKAPDTDFTSETNWEVCRNADVRPRDDEGGSPTEEQAQFPNNGSSADEFKVYICPVTGFIVYHEDAVTNSRVLRVEEHVVIVRNL